MSEILGYGYQVATDPATLTAFIASAHQALEDAIKAIDAKIEELKQDWEPRPAKFWQPILKTDIPAICGATAACMQLFNRECGQAASIIMSASIGYRFDLHCIEVKIEEAGIVLTAFLHSSGSFSVERQIRERQRLLHALQELSKAVHEALTKSRAELDNALEERARLLAPRKQRRASAQEKKPRPLHVVDAQDQAGEEAQG